MRVPNRILREGILTSPRIAKLNWGEEVFYRRLHSVVDDFGRYFADIGLLRAACYPRQLNKVSDSDVEKWLQATEKAALVRVYPAQDGERYLQVLDFGQQVRAKKSKFPQMPSTCAASATQTPANAHLDVSVSVSVSEDVSVSGDSGAAQKAPAPPPPAFLGDKNLGDIPQRAVVPLSPQWELPEAWGNDAEALGFTPPEILRQSEKFRQYWVAGKGAGTRRSLKGWRQSWSNWLGKAERYGGKP